MSEEELEVEVNPVGDLIDAIAAQNFNRAKAHFEDIISDKMNDALEQEKISVANTIFNDVDDDDLELDLEEDDDEVVEDEIEEEDDDEEI